MKKTNFILLFLILISFSVSSVAFTDESRSYQTAQVVQIEQKEEKVSPPHPAAGNSSSYSSREPSSLEVSEQNSHLFDFLFASIFKTEKYHLVTLKMEDQKLILKYQPGWSAKYAPDFIERGSVEIRFDPKKENAFIKKLNGKELKAKVIYFDKVS